MTLAAAGMLSCAAQPAFDPASIADASGEVARIEPLSWWTQMQTPLQLLVAGERISDYGVRIEGGRGVKVTATHKADSPNYLFVDVAIDAAAAPGTYYFVFSKEGREFKMPYEIAARREGSAQRRSFTTSDMIYLLMPDRFANGNPENDSTPTRRRRPTAKPSSAATAAISRVSATTWTTLPTSGQRSSGPRPCCSTTSPKDRTTATPAPTTTASTPASDRTRSTATWLPRPMERG